MTEFEIPVLDTTVDTSEPSDSVMSLGKAAVAVAMMFGLVAAGQFIYNRARAAVGVGQDNNPVPGV